ncbi:unnamed protein product [Rotaria sp. Silwood2]|nr:unnamed protein product [Rotaria sp. Silwood2]
MIYEYHSKSLKIFFDKSAIFDYYDHLNANNMVSKSSNIITKTSGFYLVTNEILQHMPETKQNEINLMNFFHQHTSVSLSITENAVSDVRVEMEKIFNKLVQKDNSY